MVVLEKESSLSIQLRRSENRKNAGKTADTPDETCCSSRTEDAATRVDEAAGRV